MIIVALLVASTLIAPDPGERPPIPTPTSVAAPTATPVAPKPIAWKPCAEVVGLDIQEPDFTPAVRWAIKEWNGHLGCVGLEVGDGLPIDWGTLFPHPAYTAVWPAHPPWKVMGVYINPDVFDPQIHFLPCIFAHELGHVLGLDDNQGPAIMDISYW